MESHAEADSTRTQGTVRDAVAVPPFMARTAVHAGVARVVLVGDLDMDTAPHVGSVVAACLAEGSTCLRLDMTGVSFCDCAGLSALLGARAAALRAGVDVAVEGIGAGTQVARLLSLIGVDTFLAERKAPVDADPVSRRSAGAVPPPHKPRRLPPSHGPSAF